MMIILYYKYPPHTLYIHKNLNKIISVVENLRAFNLFFNLLMIILKYHTLQKKNTITEAIISISH